MDELHAGYGLGYWAGHGLAWLDRQFEKVRHPVHQLAGQDKLRQMQNLEIIHYGIWAYCSTH